MAHSRRPTTHPVVRLNDVTVSVANADQSMLANLSYRFYVSDRIRGSIRAALPQPTDGNTSEIRSTPRLSFAQADFVNLHD